MSNQYYKQVERLSSIRDIRTLIHAGAYDSEIIQAIRWMSREVTRFRLESDRASSAIAQLAGVIDDKNSEIEELKQALNTERKNKELAIDKLTSFSDTVKLLHNVNLDISNTFNLGAHDYDKVVYFKEISRVQFTDTFIHYLKEILRALYGIPVRLCVIEPHMATGKEFQYDMPVHYKLTDSDVVSGDVLMLGFQKEVMSMIAKNPSRVPILIILDRAGYDKVHLTSDVNNIEHFYLASDPNDIKQNIPLTRAITYDSNTLNIPLIMDFDKLDASKKMNKYSSIPIMKAIIEVIERG